MNILLLTTHLNSGGITSYLLTLCRQLVRQDNRAWIVSSGGNREEEFVKAKAEVLTIPIRTKSELSPQIYFALPKLAGLIRRERIDVIHAQTRVTQVMGTLLSRMTGVKCVSTCHGFFKPRWSRRLFPCWGRVIAISPAVQEHLLNDFKVKENHVTLIPNGIDVADFPLCDEQSRRARRKEFQLAEGPVIGIIARLSDVKGHSVLIEAMPRILEKFPTARLFIAGVGKMGADLKQRVADRRLTAQVIFAPVVDRAADLLPLFDVFVMPSLQEGLGLSVMEAQAAGLPVVASRVGGIPSLIEHGKTGFLVDPQHSLALAELVIRLLKDPEEARMMGRRAREFIEKNFSAADMAAKTIEVYKNREA